MPLISIYGTVFNNGYVIEESIRSLARVLPNFSERYELVIVDNYSTDGTWEKLLRLKREFKNLRLFRKKCSRGRGRDLALKQTIGDYVMRVDLDTIFEPEFGIIVERLYTLCKPGEMWNFNFSTRETMIEHIGGWKDLNLGEDWEMVARAIMNGVKVKTVLTYPFMRNIRISKNKLGEMRYSNGYLHYLLRKLRNLKDTVYVFNFTPARILKEKTRVASKILALVFSMVYTLPKALRGKNLEPVDVMVQRKRKYLLPEEVGLPKDWLFMWWGRVTLVWPLVKEVVLRVVEKTGNCTIAFLMADGSLAIFRDQQIFMRWFNDMRTIAIRIKSDPSKIRLLHYSG